MAFLGPNNALAWAHFRLRGGWRRSVGFTTGAATLLLLLIIGAVYADPQYKPRILYGWTTGLLGLQAALLVLYVSGRIGAAIRQDINSKIIESHRLMPTPPSEAVAGYISGAAMQPLVFAAALFILGICTAAAAQMDLGRWVFAHGILLAFASFLWTMAAYASFSAKAGPALVFVPMFLVPYATQGGGLAALPGMMVLLSPIVGDSIFDLRTTGIVLPATYAMALAGQFLFGTMFFIASTRRYRAADGIGIDTTLGLCLVAGWSAITCVGIKQWEHFEPRGFRIQEIDHHVKLIASIIVGMLIALAPVAASAWAHSRWRRHEVLHDPAPMRRPLPVPLVIAAATILILLIPYGRPFADPPDVVDVLKSAAIVAIALSSIYFLCAWIYFAIPRAIIAGFIWILIVWGLPIITDLTRYGLSDSRTSQPFEVIAVCSPIGALIAIWAKLDAPVLAATVAQALLMCIPLILQLMQKWRVNARLRQRSAA